MNHIGTRMKDGRSYDELEKIRLNFSRRVNREVARSRKTYCCCILVSMSYSFRRLIGA